MAVRLKIAFIGGGSKAWARSLMQDLALADGLSGEVALYDIDIPAAERNRKIGERIAENPKTRSNFKYTVSETLENALTGADFVLIAITPGTLDETEVDVHAPEKYGIYQSVGDTVGPGGVLRAMRLLPMVEEFARGVRDFCPEAWVINLTNPMSACVKCLYDTYPEIKAFGCCHEVFHTQDFLCCVLNELHGIKPHRRDIYADASGINHFTWITEARYKGYDLLALLPEFMDRYYESGYYENGSADDWKTNPFSYGNRVKMDMFRRYGALAAAGDRHLVEFVSGKWYLASPELAHEWHFDLTSVAYRKKQWNERVQEGIEIAEGRRELPMEPSGEEQVRLIKAILGFETVVSNVNLPNRGQMPGIPKGSIVETNCVFTNGLVKPIAANPLPSGALALVQRNCANIDMLCDGIKNRDMSAIFSSFVNQPLCECLTLNEARSLFSEMREGTKDYLTMYI